MMQPKEESALKLVAENKAYENYFFSKVEDIKWFDRLKELGYFSPENNPKPEPAKQEGYYTIPQWNVLPYLEKISQKLSSFDEPTKEKYTKELLDFIQNVSGYRGDDEKPVDNYRTWWYLVKILLNIPNDHIPLEIIELVQLWLNSGFGRSLVDADIATKLLPKFLEGNPTQEDIQKLENLVLYLTELRWVPGKDLLDRERQTPETIAEQHWLLKSFIEDQNIQNVGQICSEDFIYKLAERLKEIFRKDGSTDHFDIETDEEIYRISFDLTKDYEFECSVGLIQMDQVKDEDKTEQLLKTLDAKAEEIVKFVVKDCKDSPSFEIAIIAEIKKIKLPEDIKRDVSNKVKPFYEQLLSDYSFVWFKHLDQRVASKIHDSKGLLAVFLLGIILVKQKADQAILQNIVDKFSSEEYQYPFFRRIVLFLVGELWEEYKETFWEFLENPGDTPLLENPNYEDEVELIFKKNVSSFTEEEKKAVEGVIRKGPQKNFPTEDKERYSNYWKQRWLNSLKSDPHFASLHEEVQKTTQSVDPSEFEEESVWIGPGPSPLTKEEILRMPNQELVAYLDKFKTENPWKGSSVDGLADLLKIIAQEKPEKFVEDFSPFLGTGYYYVYEVLSGIKEAWKSKKILDWEKLLYFIKNYIDRPDFWNDKLKVGGGFFSANHEWVAGAVGELVEEGTKSDSNAFSEKYLKGAQEIICLLLSNLKPTKEKHQTSDYTNLALNTAFGKVITGFINLALRIARLETKKEEAKEIKWSEELKKQFNSLLDKNIVEAYALLGEYMRNFLYLDKKWIEEKVKSLDAIKDKNLWIAMMDGYLWGQGINPTLYKLMKPHYLKGIKDYPEDRHPKGKLVSHIAIGYLNDLDKLGGGGLLDSLIKEWNYEQIKEFIDYLWSQREYLKETDASDPELIKKFRERILEFWKFMYEKYKDKTNLSQGDKSILSELSKLSIYLPNIDNENFEWLMLSTPFVTVDYNSPAFIENLNFLKDKGVKKDVALKISKIYLEMLKTFVPDFDSEDIISTMEYFYELKEDEVTTLANDICNKYAERNSELLSELYKKYKDQQ